jgi:hypothetical protein
MDGRAGNQINRTTEEVGQFILQVVDRETEMPTWGEDREQIQVAVMSSLSPGDRAEHLQLGDPIPVADLRDLTRIDAQRIGHRSVLASGHGAIVS